MNNEHRDYAKVIKVLKSCINMEQITVAEKMMDNYHNMYPDSKNTRFDFFGIKSSKVRQIRDHQEDQT